MTTIDAAAILQGGPCWRLPQCVGQLSLQSFATANSEIQLPHALRDSPSGVTVDSALRLSRFFGTTPELWLNMQRNYDLAHADIDVFGIEPLKAAQAGFVSDA